MKPDIQQHATQFFFLSLLLVIGLTLKLREISRDFLASPQQKQTFRSI